MTSAGSSSSSSSTSTTREAAKYCPACEERYPADGLFCPNDGSPLVAVGSVADEKREPGSGRPDPYLSREILDHIAIKELVGIGAMGRVYRAFQKGIDRDVAVKILHRELSANPQLVSRFLREAKVASRLSHPNVVNVILSGQLPDGALYIVMEYLHGQSLQAALGDAGGGFDLSRALHIGLQLCDAVGEAHVQGIVHRDLKPENVMLVRRGQDADFVKVLDFGIARLNWSEQSMATATGLIFGTARYISPEGAQGEKVGPAGDVYSIATLLYQMLAGRTPFEGDQAVGLLIQQIHQQPPPLRSHAHAHEVPPSIADVVMRGLAKDPQARPENARSFGRALVEAARASGVAADDYYARSLYATPSSQRSGSNQARKSEPSVATAAPHRPSESSRDVGDVPVAGPTARWTPPAAVQAQLASIAENRKAARASAPSSPSVDPTLDDDDLQPAAPKTEYSTPAPQPASFSGTVRLPSSPGIPTGPTGTLPLKNDVDRISDRVLVTPPPRPRTESSPSSPRLPSRPPDRRSSPEAQYATTAGDGTDEVARRGKTIGIIVLCFLLGVGGAVALHRTGVLPKMGQGGAAASAAGLDAHLTRTREAIDRERWDEPRGENVRELLSVGLQRYPQEPRLLALRAQASEMLIRRAVALRASRDTKEAARLARIASEIVPDNETTRALAAEYATEAETGVPPLTPPITTSVTAPKTPTPPRTPSSGAPAVTAAKVSLETAPAKPRIGAPVQLLARVSATKSGVTDAAFVVVSPGNPAGTRLVPVSDGTIFRAAFTFMEAGRYEVSFTGKADGAVIRSARPIQIEGAAPPTNDPPTAPTGSVKWL